MHPSSNRLTQLSLLHQKNMTYILSQYLNKNDLFSFPIDSFKFGNLTITNISFSIPRYASRGLKRLGLSSEIPDHILEEASCFLEQWRQVVTFYSLRLSLSPAVESLILLDRQLYLHEQGLYFINCIVD